MGSVFDPMPLVLGSRALSSATYTAPSPDLTPREVGGMVRRVL
jgi:hypothetical protein